MENNSHPETGLNHISFSKQLDVSSNVTHEEMTSQPPSTPDDAMHALKKEAALLVTSIQEVKNQIADLNQDMSAQKDAIHHYDQYVQGKRKQVLEQENENNHLTTSDEALQSKIASNNNVITVNEKTNNNLPVTQEKITSLDKNTQNQSKTLLEQIVSLESQIQKQNITLKQNKETINTLTQANKASGPDIATVKQQITEKNSDINNEQQTIREVDQKLDSVTQSSDKDGTPKEALSKLSSEDTQLIDALKEKKQTITHLQSALHKNSPTTNTLITSESLNIPNLTETLIQEPVMTAQPKISDVPSLMKEYSDIYGTLQNEQQQDAQLAKQAKEDVGLPKSLQASLNKSHQSLQNSSNKIKQDNATLSQQDEKISTQEAKFKNLSATLQTQHQNLISDTQKKDALVTQKNQLESENATDNQSISSNTNTINSLTAENKDASDTKQKLALTEQALNKQELTNQENLKNTQDFLENENNHLSKALELPVNSSESDNSQTRPTVRNGKPFLLSKDLMDKSSIAGEITHNQNLQEQLRDALHIDDQTISNDKTELKNENRQAWQKQLDAIKSQISQLTQQIETIESYQNNPQDKHNEQIEDDLKNSQTTITHAQSDIKNAQDLEKQSQNPPASHSNTRTTHAQNSSNEDTHRHDLNNVSREHKQGKEDRSAVEKDAKDSSKSNESLKNEGKDTLDHLQNDSVNLNKVLGALPTYTDQDIQNARDHLQASFEHLEQTSQDNQSLKPIVGQVKHDLSENMDLSTAEHRDRDYNILETENATLSSSEQAEHHKQDEQTGLCFCSYTQIRTISGDVSVQDLNIGDIVITSTGEEKPIKWIGRKNIRLKGNVLDKKVTPVRIKRHALGDNLPTRDLFVSPAHGIAFDVKTRDIFFQEKYKRVMVRAGDLINETTIFQDPMHAFTYWHIELSEHALLIANGALAVSFIDNGERETFHSFKGIPQQKNGFFSPKQKVIAPRIKRGRDLRSIKKLLREQEKIICRGTDILPSSA